MIKNFRNLLQFAEKKLKSKTEKEKEKISRVRIKDGAIVCKIGKGNAEYDCVRNIIANNKNNDLFVYEQGQYIPQNVEAREFGTPVRWIARRYGPMRNRSFVYDYINGRPVDEELAASDVSTSLRECVGVYVKRGDEYAIRVALDGLVELKPGETFADFNEFVNSSKRCYYINHGNKTYINAFDYYFAFDHDTNVAVKNDIKRHFKDNCRLYSHEVVPPDPEIYVNEIQRGIKWWDEKGQYNVPGEELSIGQRVWGQEVHAQNPNQLNNENNNRDSRIENQNQGEHGRAPVSVSDLVDDMARQRRQNPMRRTVFLGVEMQREEDSLDCGCGIWDSVKRCFGF